MMDPKTGTLLVTKANTVIQKKNNKKICLWIQYSLESNRWKYDDD
jgi:hypothetical protein